MRKLVSILLTLAVAVSLLVVPTVVSADAPEVTVPFEFLADGRPELKGGNVSLVGENLIIEFTAMGQNAKPEETNKHTAIFFDANLADKDLSTASGWDMPWDENNYVLVNNWFTTKDMAHPESLSWRQSFVDAEHSEYECPWGSPVPGPGTMYSDSDDWPAGLSFVYELVGDDIKWTATVPTSLLGIEPGDTFGMLVAARDENTDYGTTNAEKLSLNSWPTMVHGFSAGYDLRDYALVTIPNTTVGLTAKLSSIVAINVDPPSIDFGTITPGTPQSGDPITVENIGTVEVDVDADLNLGTVFDYLQLNGSYSSSYCGHWDIITGLSPNADDVVTTGLDVPSSYSAQGVETETLVFEASPAA